MTLETALKAANIQRMPTPKTTDGTPPSAAIAAVGVISIADVPTAAAVATGRGVCGAAKLRPWKARRAMEATSKVISLDERAMAAISRS